MVFKRFEGLNTTMYRGYGIAVVISCPLFAIVEHILDFFKDFRHTSINGRVLSIGFDSVDIQNHN